MSNSKRCFPTNRVCAMSLEPCPHSAYSNLGDLGVLRDPIVEATWVPDVHRICCILNSVVRVCLVAPSRWAPGTRKMSCMDSLVSQSLLGWLSIIRVGCKWRLIGDSRHGKDMIIGSRRCIVCSLKFSQPPRRIPYAMWSDWKNTLTVPYHHH